MAKVLVVFFIATVISASYGMSFRQKRQSDNEDKLEERYGWDRPERPRQNWFPNQNQNGQGQFPWQNQNQNGQGQFPWQNQNQNGGQGQFPWQNQNQNGGQGQFPWQNQNQNGQNQPTPTPTPNGSSTQPPSVQQCVANCPVTPEYNPICGTDMVTYTNPGRLGCAQACGVNVSLLRYSPCPTTTTAAPPS